MKIKILCISILA